MTHPVQIVRAFDDYRKKYFNPICALHRDDTSGSSMNVFAGPVKLCRHASEASLHSFACAHSAQRSSYLSTVHNLQVPTTIMPRHATFAALALLLATQLAAAQQTARIEGVLTDSTHNKPLSDATVFITRVEPAQPEFLRTLVTDRDGRYRLDSLAAGRYSVWFSHPALDSLDLAVALHEITLAAGQHGRADFAIPSGATLRQGACPGVQFPPRTGAVIGTVINAETDKPLAGASVVVGWTDIAVDRTTLRATTTERTGSVRVDSAGVYRLCGVPTGSVLVLQVQSDGRAGSALQTDVSDSVGIKRLDLSFSAKASRVLAIAAPSADTATTELLTGTAIMTGTVRNSAGTPLAEVTLRVVDAAGSARSDSLGRFTLNGLPAGSQVLEARRLGYFIGRQPVGLHNGRTIDVQLRLDRIVSLDSIRVVAQRNKYREFEQNKHSAFGRFFTADQIAERHAFETSELFYMIPGFRVVGSGFDARVASGRVSGLGRPCLPNVVIDNMQHQEINLIRPSDIGAMEVYSDATGGPVGANRGCGAIVIWTKR
jgi:hypothetical protein